MTWKKCELHKICNTDLSRVGGCSCKILNFVNVPLLSIATARPLDILATATSSLVPFEQHRQLSYHYHYFPWQHIFLTFCERNCLHQKKNQTGPNGHSWQSLVTANTSLILGPSDTIDYVKPKIQTLFKPGTSLSTHSITCYLPQSTTSLGSRYDAIWLD